jgi:hypothetical protein
MRFENKNPDGFLSGFLVMVPLDIFYISITGALKVLGSLCKPCL